MNFMPPSKLTKTGIEGLDEQLGGGLPEKSLILLLGEPGSGIDVFAQQVLFSKASKGEKVIYFTAERAPADIEEEMRLFGWDLEKAKADGSWAFIDAYTPRHARTTARVGAITILRTDLIPKIEEGAYSTLDSISHLLLMFDLRDVVDTIELLTIRAREKGGLHFILMGRGMHDPKTVSTMTHIVDGVFEFLSRERARELERLIRIRKMRRAVYGIHLLPFRITERGIVVETAIRIA